MAIDSVVVMGASAGGLQPLRSLASRITAGFQGSIFIVLHIGKQRSLLPDLLSAAGALPAVHPKDGETIKEGVIYVAPPDRHMLLEPNCIRLSAGPKENFARPAINPLFRSAAAAFGSKVVGILLSGSLDHGVLGLAEVKQHGGTAIVQDPKTASFPSTPSCALNCVDVDHVSPPEDMPAILESARNHRAAIRTGINIEQHRSALTCPEFRWLTDPDDCGDALILFRQLQLLRWTDVWA